MIAPPRAVLFDWDGTLVDNWPVIYRALNETLIDFGHRPWTLAETMERVSRSQRDSFPSIFGDCWEDARDRFYRRFTERHLSDLSVLPGAIDLLHHLAGLKIWAGVVSNKRGDFLREEAAHLGWTHFFGSIVGASDAVEDKPSAAPVRLALAETVFAPSRDIWFVGDSATDIRTARSAGCVAVLVTQPGGSPMPMPADLTADLEVEGLAALAPLVRPPHYAI